jgi:hypothetical protein
MFSPLTSRRSKDKVFMELSVTVSLESITMLEQECRDLFCGFSRDFQPANVRNSSQNLQYNTQHDSHGSCNTAVYTSHKHHQQHLVNNPRVSAGANFPWKESVQSEETRLWQ